MKIVINCAIDGYQLHRKLVEIPDDIDYGVIETDCGSEYIVDATRIWS